MRSRGGFRFAGLKGQSGSAGAHRVPQVSSKGDTRCAPSRWFLPSTAVSLRGWRHLFPAQGGARSSRCRATKGLSFDTPVAAPHVCLTGTPRPVSDERETIFCRPLRPRLRFKHRPKAPAPPRRQRFPVYPMAGREEYGTGAKGGDGRGRNLGRFQRQMRQVFKKT